MKQDQDKEIEKHQDFQMKKNNGYNSFLSYLDQYEPYDKSLKENAIFCKILINGVKIGIEIKMYGADLEVKLQTEFIEQQQIEEIQKSAQDDIISYISNYLNTQQESLRLVMDEENRYLITYRYFGDDEELIQSQCEKKLIEGKNQITQLLAYILKNGDGEIDELISKLSLNM